MSLRDLAELQAEVDQLTPHEQSQLARYLLAKLSGHNLRPTGDLSEFRGSLKLNVDPVEFQRSIRAEWL